VSCSSQHRPAVLSEASARANEERWCSACLCVFVFGFSSNVTVCLELPATWQDDRNTKARRHKASDVSVGKSVVSSCLCVFVFCVFVFLI
jgi:hypothetical protein